MRSRDVREPLTPTELEETPPRLEVDGYLDPALESQGSELPSADVDNTEDPPASTQIDDLGDSCS